jgi:molecular chaperone HtpG
MEDTEKLLPRYLRFVRALIDSGSLPLNVSREILQENKQLEKIRSGAVKKVLGLLEDTASNEPEKYATFWKEFGSVLKEGPIEDFKNRERIAKLLRFASTHTGSDAQTVSLADYLERMPEDQDKIYYITAESYGAAANSPHLEVFRTKGVEVLLLHDRVDEWLVGYLTEYEGKHLQSVAKGDLDLSKLGGDEATDKEQQEKLTEELKPLTERVKTALGDSVSDVRISHRLTESASCLISEDYGLSRTMERIMKAAGQQVPTRKPVLEINPSHALVNHLKNEADEQRFSDLARILFDQAVLSEGGQLDDPSQFVHRMNSLLQGLMQ